MSTIFRAKPQKFAVRSIAAGRFPGQYVVEVDLEGSGFATVRVEEQRSMWRASTETPRREFEVTTSTTPLSPKQERQIEKAVASFERKNGRPGEHAIVGESGLTARYRMAKRSRSGGFYGTSRNVNQQLTKKGRHGTLRRYAIEYDDPIDPGFGKSLEYTWAYDVHHAIDMFMESLDGDSWRPLRIAAVTAGSPHGWHWQKV